jgi:hypothetical protein
MGFVEFNTFRRSSSFHAFTVSGERLMIPRNLSQLSFPMVSLNNLNARVNITNITWIGSACGCYGGGTRSHTVICQCVHFNNNKEQNKEQWTVRQNIQRVRNLREKGARASCDTKV